jgi:hypothetical protein
MLKIIFPIPSIASSRLKACISSIPISFISYPIAIIDVSNRMNKLSFTVSMIILPETLIFLIIDNYNKYYTSYLAPSGQVMLPYPSLNPPFHSPL